MEYVHEIAFNILKLSFADYMYALKCETWGKSNLYGENITAAVF